MKKKIILRSFIILGIAFIIYESYSIVSMIANTNLEVLENVRTIDLKNDKSIAIMVQDANTDEWHEADNRDSWPDPSKYGFVGAECTDSEGATIDWEKVLTFSLANKTATIKTKQTAYCTLYFAKGTPALDWLKQKGGTTFAGSDHTTVIDGMYRFVGTKDTVTNNYICFGTTIESECLKTPETYMYRIIGITSAKDETIGLYANQLKLIKATPSSESQRWNSSYTDIKWDSSAMKSYLNGTFYNSIRDAQPNGTYWESMISNHKWYNADYTSVPATEPTTSHTAESKIGLMYATDYKNSGNQNTNNWLYIKNGWSTNTSGTTLYEWTMSRNGLIDSSCYAWGVKTEIGGLNRVSVGSLFEVRPVFYLQTGVNLMGEGTNDHPYIIATMNNA